MLSFFRRDSDEFLLRWFTPAAEVALCGHATLATAKIIFDVYKNDNKVRNNQEFIISTQTTREFLQSVHYFLRFAVIVIYVQTLKFTTLRAGVLTVSRDDSNPPSLCMNFPLDPPTIDVSRDSKGERDVAFWSMAKNMLGEGKTIEEIKLSPTANKVLVVRIKGMMTR